MLIYDEPINQGKADPGRAAMPASGGFSVLDLVELLWRRKITIAAAALLGACLAVAIGKSLTPKYTASAQLYVDPRELQLVDRELTPRAPDLNGLAMVVESQARVITSNNVLLRVIDETKLETDPEFGGGDGKSLFGTLLGLFGIERKPTAEQQRQVKMAALEALLRQINVKKTDKTFIVDIDVRSTDPAKAAMLANAIAKAYLAENSQSQAVRVRRATSDLSGRLDELKDRLRNAENALAVYKAANNFVGTQDTLISDQQLSASNQRLSAARALTLDAQAKYDQIAASRKASTDAGAIPEALQSPTIANLRSQFADAKKRQAELQSELGPRHPALRQVEQQVEDLRRSIGEETNRFLQAAKNDLTRAQEYEASLNKALETQKRQSVQLSQAAIRLRDLERDVEASRDVYQSFLKRSRETEEQETLNTSSARIIGDATVPQKRSFPPGMALFAMIGFALGGLGAAAWVIGVSQLVPANRPGRPARILAEPETAADTPAAATPAPATRAPPRPGVSLIAKPLITRLQEADVVRALGGIMAISGTPEVTRLGWPVLRSGPTQTPFLTTMRETRAVLATRSPKDIAPVLAVTGAGSGEQLGIAALNIALAAARDGGRVLLIDADQRTTALSNKVKHLGRADPGRRGWLNLTAIAASTSREIGTANGITILPTGNTTDGKANDAVHKAIAQARSAGKYDLVVIGGAAMPWDAADHSLFDLADALVAVLPIEFDINECMEDIITALGETERKLVGVVINELHPTGVNRQRDKQYA